MAIRLADMTANISASAKKFYIGIGQLHVNWERIDINSELNVGRIFN